MYNKLLEQIKRNDTIIIHRHKNPDGDAIGSQIGLKLVLQESFPLKRILAVGDEPGRYGFVEGAIMDVVADELYKDSLAIVLDTSAKHLISDDRYQTAKETARIDHHLFVEEICQNEIVDTTFESCAGLIANIVKTLELKLTPLAAKALYTGMVTDSGRFRYDSTTPKTFLMASYLLSAGFNPADIYTNLYADDFKMIQLKARFVLKIKFTENNVAYIFTTKEEVKEYGATEFTISRGMVSTMAEIRGVNVWVNFTETENGVLAELRSSTKDINKIAVKYGGGGHKKASGATLKDFDQAKLMLEDLNKLAGEIDE